MNFDGLPFLTALVMFKQSDYLNHSNKESDAWGIQRILYHKENREALISLYPIVKKCRSRLFYLLIIFDRISLTLLWQRVLRVICLLPVC